MADWTVQLAQWLSAMPLTRATSVAQTAPFLWSYSNKNPLIRPIDYEQFHTPMQGTKPESSGERPKYHCASQTA